MIWYSKLPKSLITVTTFSKALALILFIFLPIIGFYLGFYFGASGIKLQSNNSQTTCTQEAKLCPDGSYVGRVGLNCEFAKCPKNDSTITPTCRPRPACLDATPRCMIPETSDMCPPTKICPNIAWKNSEGKTCTYSGVNCDVTCK